MADLAMAEARFRVGQKAEAAAFARRAKQALKPGTPEWRQAADILLAAAPDAAGEKKSDEAPGPDSRSPRPPGEVPDPTGT
jgi:predicted Zn-dependent protease